MFQDVYFYTVGSTLCSAQGQYSNGQREIVRKPKKVRVVSSKVVTDLPEDTDCLRM